MSIYIYIHLSITNTTNISIYLSITKTEVHLSSHTRLDTTTNTTPRQHARDSRGARPGDRPTAGASTGKYCAGFKPPGAAAPRSAIARRRCPGPGRLPAARSPTAGGPFPGAGGQAAGCLARVLPGPRWLCSPRCRRSYSHPHQVGACVSSSLSLCGPLCSCCVSICCRPLSRSLPTSISLYCLSVSPRVCLILPLCIRLSLFPCVSVCLHHPCL